MRGKKDWPNPYDFPQNLYEEQTQRKGFLQERYYHPRGGDDKPKRALRLTIECKNRKTSNACDAKNYNKCY